MRINKPTGSNYTQLLHTRKMNPQGTAKILKWQLEMEKK